ncbi:uncharacterized protein [Linepithema humile]|uniref:uncharacterized protein n=1 Tax=Linepithema humile TaxID=83485 RepID=UPI00351E7650
MDTRNKKGPKPEGGFSESKIEIMSAKLAQQQSQLQMQHAELQKQDQALRIQRKQFERERDESLQLLAGERQQIRQKELESRQLQESKDAFKNEILRELSQLRQEVDSTRLTNRERRYNQQEEQAEMSPIPKVSFREATESVPTFDGYNVPLSQFVCACRRARELVPSFSERNLTKLLINKLRGRAYYAVEDEPCKTITQLIDLLTTAFGSPKTVDQYRGELSTVYIKPNKHMLDYISRIKELRAAILDTERRVKGLQMPLDEEFDPFKAFGVAKTPLAKRHELDRQRYDTRPKNERIPERYPVTSIGRPLAQSTPNHRYNNNTNSRNEPIYRDSRGPTAPRHGFANRENAPGHNQSISRNQNLRNEYQNPTRVETARNLRPNNNNNNNNNTVEKWCRYCKNRGHEIEECRKQEYNNSQKLQSGNAQNPSGQTGAPRADFVKNSRPINVIEATPSTSSESQP